jgi:hypothetical protein
MGSINKTLMIGSLRLLEMFLPGSPDLRRHRDHHIFDCLTLH